MEKGPNVIPSAPWWRSDWAFWLLLAAVTFLAYQPAWDGQLLWDDDQFTTRQDLETWSGLFRIWTEPRVIRQYYPVVATLFWIQIKLWGHSLFIFHLVNIFVHTVGALMLLRVLRRLEIPGAWLATALFALHPVQVESVAWNFEIKNTLSGAFCLGAALVYLKFDERRRWTTYTFALGLFAAALLSKTVVATLPAALLVVFWWKRGKLSWKQDVLPLLPFFALSLSSGILSVWMEHNVVGASGKDFAFSFVERSIIAGRALWFYLGKLVWPHPLIFIYPRWHISQTIWWQYLFPLSMLGLLAVLWWLRGKARGPLAALLLFGGTLFPALGFFNVYPFRFSFVADHFQYLACIAPLTLFAAGVALALKGNARPIFGIVLASALIILTWRQSHMYADVHTLWKTTLARNPNAWIAHGHLGWTLFQEGDVDSAIRHLEAALKIRPDDDEVRTSLALALQKNGQILRQRGQLDAAVPSLEKAVQLKPNDAMTHRELGLALHQKGRIGEAIARYQRALEIKPEYGEIHNDLAVALVQTGQTPEAILQFKKGLAASPDNVENLDNLAWMLATATPPALRNGPEAVEHAERAATLTLRKEPSVLHTLSAAYAAAGRFEEAVTIAREALRLAESRSDAALAETIRKEIPLYQSRRAL